MKPQRLVGYAQASQGHLDGAPGFPPDFPWPKRIDAAPLLEVPEITLLRSYYKCLTNSSVANDKITSECGLKIQIKLGTLKCQLPTFPP